MIEKFLFPELKINELVIEDGLASAHIVDAELDPIRCTFDYSDSVTLDTSGLDYICLTPENLRTLLKLIRKSENYYENESE